MIILVLGIGVDIIENQRFESWIKNPKKIERFFSQKEIFQCKMNKENTRNSLAVRFAAKEAFAKATGLGFGKFILKELQILNKENGKPFISLSGKAAEIFKNLDPNKVHVSFSHEKNYSVAMVVIEK